MFQVGKNGKIPEEEFLFIFSDTKEACPYNCLSVKNIPIIIEGKRVFIMILKDISKFVAFSSIISYIARQNQVKTVISLDKIITNYYKYRYLSEEGSEFIIDYLYRQGELGQALDWLLGYTELRLSDFDIKTEVVNTVHTCWTSWKNKDIKINLLCDKDISCARLDRYKHNQLLRILLEYSLQQIDYKNDILIVITRTVRYI